MTDGQRKDGVVKKNKRMTLILAGGVLFMFGFSYLLVPIYNIVCKQIGFNGKGANSASVMAADMRVDTSRTIKVEFATVVNSALDFKFTPLYRTVEMHPGETRLVYFYAENLTGKGKTIQAVPSVTPADAARFLKKTECFCFTQQYFYKGEKADMPVSFFIDPAIPNNIKEITLSYTLFDASGYEKKQPQFRKGRINL
ncbi:cytochrome c oxidase assembly protein [Aquicella lusitana]|uniref:Cytochrome c oxidase assembly protein CtaG n=1 Tax=Aquicella lusitana TaxID=254246 RepID=A0A370GN69_9COXI|nr:cytochrome c oxidase assembly protein [Aquicella lusitana]RDI43363.1 cytochrome c oxidase assembly protein subunit 11 [Aquicella lusitana]VVC73513.1 Cytochrome c oxidase assembly protein CtaG [Aquicella lusitana]